MNCLLDLLEREKEACKNFNFQKEKYIELTSNDCPQNLLNDVKENVDASKKALNNVRSEIMNYLLAIGGLKT